MLLITGVVAMAQGYVAQPVRLTQTQINLIASQCKVPRSWMRLQRDGSLRLQFPATARYEKADCILEAIRPHLNEKPVEKPE